MVVNAQFVHPRFKLNGFHLNFIDLSRVGYSYIKEGEDFEKQIGDFMLEWTDANDFVVVQTSGSTGKPKSISIKKEAMVHSAINTGAFFELNAGANVVLALPAKYIAGKMMLVRAFILGLELDVFNPSTTPFSRIEKNYDFAALTPLQAEMSFDKLSHFKIVIIGGAQIHSELETKLKKLPTTVFETYGMTETITHIAAKRVEEDHFTVLPNVNIKCSSDSCLIVSTPYFEGEIITNDVVKLTSDATFVWLGRKDNIINTAGVKINPEVVEKKLSKKIKNRFYITSKKDKNLGEKVVLVIEGEQQEISASVFSDLEKFENPKEIIFETIFEEVNSKIKRKTF